jgi:hypothetical protein
MAKAVRKRPEQTKAIVFTVKEFCLAHRISVSIYYALKKQGLGPREMRVGHRWFISHDAAAEWRKQREENIIG